MEDRLSNGNIKKHIEHYYQENCKMIFETFESELKEKIESILNLKGKDFDLVNDNTVYQGKYYKVVSRVKTPESVSEKLYRNNKILDILDKSGITKNSELTSCNQLLKQTIYEFDDIIGVKILGELEADVKNIYKLIKENIKEFETLNIKLFLGGKQPVSMKNGIEIFKIKGIYKDEYNFELQIKSQLSSAWGDMEHQLFYKDNTYTPLKGPVQSIMNEIGKLIEGIDELLYKVRVSQKEYDSEKNTIMFNNKLIDIYSVLIKDFLELPYIGGILGLSKLLKQLSEVIEHEDLESDASMDAWT